MKRNAQLRRLCLLLAPLLLLPSCGRWGSEQAMYPVGTTWTAEDSSFTVVEPSFRETWETETGEVISPEEDCILLTVACSVSLGEGANLASCVFSWNSTDSGEYPLLQAPVFLTEGTVSGGGNCVLLFSLPEEEVSAHSESSCCLTVCMAMNGKTYSEDFTFSVEED